jgi:hypothetical protein
MGKMVSTDSVPVPKQSYDKKNIDNLSLIKIKQKNGKGQIIL